MRVFALLLVLLLVSNPVSGAVVSSINIDVNPSGVAKIVETLAASGETGEDEVMIPKKADDISVFDSNGILNFEKTSAKDWDVVRFYYTPVKTDIKDVKISYSSRQMTSKSGDTWTLKFGLQSTPYRTILKISLPFNSTIMDWEPQGPFSPSENGIYVYPTTEEFDFTLTYNFSGGDITSDYSYLYYGFAIVIIAAIAVFHKRITKKPEEKDEQKKPPAKKKTKAPKKEPGKREIKDSVLKMLEENEMKIVDMLVKAGEEITQAHIYNETRIPKASLSDIMKRLERRNIIERRKDGRRNWVKLEEWVFK